MMLPKEITVFFNEFFNHFLIINFFLNPQLLKYFECDEIASISA